MTVYPQEMDRGVVAGTPWFGNMYPCKDVATREDVARTFDYTIESAPLFYQAGNGEYMESPLAKAFQARVDTDDEGNPRITPLSVMSDKFGTPNFTERFLASYDAIMDSGVDAELTSVGTVANGARGFMTIKLPEGFSYDIGGVEHTDQFFNLLDSVDGKTSFKATTTAFSIACSNALSTLAFGVPTLFSIRHTANSDRFVAEALGGLRASMAEAVMMGEAIDQLLNQVFTEAEFFDMVRSPDMLDWRANMADEDKNTAQMERIFAEITHTYHNSPDTEHCRETAYGAIQTLNNWETKEATVKTVSREVRNFNNLHWGNQKMTEKAGLYLGTDEIRKANLARANEVLATV